MPNNIEFYTDFADGAIMFPLGLVVPVILLTLGQRRPALAWTVAIGCVWTAMLFLKLAGYTVAALFPTSAFSAIDLVTPSGHVASAASIYGGLIGLFISKPGTTLRRSLIAALAVAILIGATRVLLGVHSLSEVLVGGTVGIAGAAGVAWAAGNAFDSRARLPILTAMALIVITFHGDHSSWEEPIHEAALRLIHGWIAHT